MTRVSHYESVEIQATQRQCIYLSLVIFKYGYKFGGTFIVTLEGASRLDFYIKYLEWRAKINV